MAYLHEGSRSGESGGLRSILTYSHFLHRAYMTNPCRYVCSIAMLSDAQLQIVHKVCPLHKARH